MSSIWTGSTEAMPRWKAVFIGFAVYPPGNYRPRGCLNRKVAFCRLKAKWPVRQASYTKRQITWSAPEPAARR